jgi:hypothetical protein
MTAAGGGRFRESRMAEVRRSSDVVEAQAERALTFGIGGVVAVLIGIPVLIYFSALVGLAWALIVGGLGAIGYAGYCLLQVRKVPSVLILCPFCRAKNKLTEQPSKDFTCFECHRSIPVQDGRVLRVFQVKCGFCGSLNYYSEKSVGLICESCDREIPLATESGELATRAFRTYTQRDDDKTYDLVLIAAGHKTEEMIGTLQHMLALNRNQVKEMLLELPVTLLQGIPRRKAEMLQAQLAVLGAAADFRETGSS